ncbi:MAG: PEP-CTERM sorting domain-containing protein [Fimbriimonadaceae bacterium]|nr:PEP-CTERM sorting domain-containing protein [Fimbriimonadaceae bacterium]
MKKLLLTAMAVTGTASAFAAAPTNFIDLGNVFDTDANYQNPDAGLEFGNGIAAGEIIWMKFTFAGTNGTTNYLDIDTINVAGFTGSATPVDTELGLYDSVGNLVSNDDDGGYGLFSLLSFGNTTDRQFTQSGALGARDLSVGQDGVLAGGTYWLALGQFNTTFGALDWDVTSTGGGDVDPFRVEFRTDASAVPEPASMIALGAGLLALARRRKSK